MNEYNNGYIDRKRMTGQGCSQCLGLEKQLKVQQADYEFQIKKIKEDKSTEKAIYEVHLQKEVRKWQDAYQKEKGIREQQNYNWICKHDATKSKYEEMISSIKSQSEKSIKQTTQRLIKQHTDKYNRKIVQYDTLISQTTKQFEGKLQTALKQKQDTLSSLRQSHHNQLNQIKALHQNNMQQLTRNSDSKILGLQSQLKKQEEIHKRNLQQSKQARNKLYQEIFELRKNIRQLQQDLSNKISMISILNTTIVAKDEQMCELLRQHQRILQQTEQRHKQELQKQKSRFMEVISQKKQEQKKFCEQYQAMIQKMEEGRAAEKQLYLDSIQQVEQNVEMRMSRPDDLLEIENLKEKLAKKAKESELLFEELKWYRLELENKEQTYNKIFVPLAANNTSNHESVIGKRKQFKLRRQGRSVTTVRQILQSMNSNGSNMYNSNQYKKTPVIPRSKVL